MLAACNVFGKRTGERAAARARSAGNKEFNESSLEPAMNRMNGFGQGSGESSWFDVRKALKIKAGRSLIAVRDAELLEESTSECSWLRNQQLHDVTVSNSDELLRVLETDNLHCRLNGKSLAPSH